MFFKVFFVVSSIISLSSASLAVQVHPSDKLLDLIGSFKQKQSPSAQEEFDFLKKIEGIGFKFDCKGGIETPYGKKITGVKYLISPVSLHTGDLNISPYKAKSSALFYYAKITLEGGVCYTTAPPF